MSIENYAVFIAPSGGKIEGIALQLNKDRHKANVVRSKFVKACGALGTFGSDYGLRGLIFKDGSTLPVGWRADAKNGSHLGSVAIPALKTPEGKKYAVELKALPALPGSDSFTRLIGTDWVSGRSSASRTGLVLMKCWFEKIDETLFVMVPWKHASETDDDNGVELTEKNRTCFKPEGCEQVGLSRYYAAKETLVAQTKEKA